MYVYITKYNCYTYNVPCRGYEGSIIYTYCIVPIADD